MKACLKDKIEYAPDFIKKTYIQYILYFKRSLNRLGVIDWLDNKAKNNNQFHYIRSLLAIGQLDDMVALDVPWWTYPAISRIEEFLTQIPAAKVFEYGSGASTIWLSKRSHSVVSIEHHVQWYRRLSKYLDAHNNVRLHLAPLKPITSQKEVLTYQSFKAPKLNFEAYVNSLEQFEGPFDLIIIDGRCRQACLSLAVTKLKESGLIVFDNSNRGRYQACLQQPGFAVERFPGRPPGSPFQSETAILYRA